MWPAVRIRETITRNDGFLIPLEISVMFTRLLTHSGHGAVCGGSAGQERDGAGLDGPHCAPRPAGGRARARARLCAAGPGHAPAPVTRTISPRKCTTPSRAALLSSRCTVPPRRMQSCIFLPLGSFPGDGMLLPFVLCLPPCLCAPFVFAQRWLFCRVFTCRHCGLRHHTPSCFALSLFLVPRRSLTRSMTTSFK